MIKGRETTTQRDALAAVCELNCAVVGEWFTEAVSVQMADIIRRTNAARRKGNA